LQDAKGSAVDQMDEAAKKVKKAGEKLQDAAGSAWEQMGGASEEMGKAGENLQDAKGSAVDQMDEAAKKVKKAGENLQDATDKAGDLGDGVQDSGVQDAVKKVNEGMDEVLDRAQDVEQSGRETVKAAREKIGQLDDVDAINTGDGASSLAKNKKLTENKFLSALRFVVGIGGLEHLSWLQQMVVALEKFQQRMQALMEFYQALYKLAMSEEEVRNVTYAGQIEAINTEGEARQEFLQMIIDHQMSDIQSLMSNAKASFERAAEVIREYGETSRMVAQNIVG
jgi:hypothetical protein